MGCYATGYRSCVEGEASCDAYLHAYMHGMHVWLDAVTSIPLLGKNDGVGSKEKDTNTKLLFRVSHPTGRFPNAKAQEGHVCVCERVTIPKFKANCVSNMYRSDVKTD